VDFAAVALDAAGLDVVGDLAMNSPTPCSILTCPRSPVRLRPMVALIRDDSGV
jgi:hypothetical protein